MTGGSGVTQQDAVRVSEAFIREFGSAYATGMDDRGRISDVHGVVAVRETGRRSGFRLGR
jgi:hypothetical protein